MEQVNNTMQVFSELLTREELTSIRSGENPWANTKTQSQEAKNASHNEINLVAS